MTTHLVPDDTAGIPDGDEYDESVRVFRGVMFGVFFSLPIWALFVAGVVGAVRLFS